MIADANRVALAYGREVSFNLSLPPINVDGSNGTDQLWDLRFTKSAMKLRKDTVKSDEIIATREVNELIRVGIGANGSTDHEFSLRNFDDLICSGLQANDFAAVVQSCNISVFGQRITPVGGTPFAPLLMAKYVRVAGATNPANNGIKILLPNSTTSVLNFGLGSFTNVEAAVTLTFYTNFVSVLQSLTGDFHDVDANHYQFTVTAGGPINPDLAGARYLKLTGFADAGNNGIFPAVVNVALGTITVTGNAQLFTDEVGNTPTFQACYARTGTNRQSHVLQQSYLDAGKFAIYTGQCVDTLELKLDAKTKAMLSLGFMGYGRQDRAYPINSQNNAFAALTSDNTNVAGGDTVTIDGKVYTFRAALTPLEGEVLIGVSADVSLLNLIHAINHTGVPNTEYKCAAAHPTVTADAAVATHNIYVRAKALGSLGNALVVAKASAHLTWSSATLAAGMDDVNAAFTTSVVNASNNVGNVTTDGTVGTNPVKSLSFKVSNNSRERPVVGALGTQELGSGDSDVTGSMAAYFADNTLLAKFNAHVPIALEFPLIDADGNLFNTYMPRVQISDGTPEVSGKNTDVMQTLPFQATHDPVSGYTLQVDMLHV